MSYLENSNNILDEINKQEQNQSRSSIGYNIALVVAVTAFGAYIYSLLFGTTSAMALLDIENKQEQLHNEYNRLQNQNQKLQKKYFELIQLTPDEDAF
jgi:cell division protein FtsB